jgi:hypothetical protein
MDTIEGKLFVGTRALVAFFVFLFMVSFDGGRRFQEAISKQLIYSLVGLGLVIFIAINYGKRKNWARIWMLILSYLSIIFLVKDIADIGKVPNIRGLQSWMTMAVVVDVVCIIAIVIVLVRVHGNKSFGAPPASLSGESPGSEPPPPSTE